MATVAAFSRLQLAAALLEYDNDPDNPDAPYRSAQESAIFAHLRRNPAARPEVASRKSDYLGVSLPSESGSLGGRETAQDSRRSRASKSSIDALHNPFGADNNSEEEDEEAEQGLEVDLASWGLDAFIPKDKKTGKGKGKQPTPAVGSTRSRLPSANNNHDSSLPPARHGLITSKSISLGGDIEASHVLGSSMDERRRSFGSPLDLVGMEPSVVPIHARQRATSQASLPASSALVPFPSQSIRPPSPGAEQAYGESMSRAHGRTYSTASMNSRMLLEDDRDDAASQHPTFFNDAASKVVEENPFTIQNPSHISRFDPKANSRARSYSNATMGSRLMPEHDNASTFTGDPYARERRYSTLELLRPKVLVMPSPLQRVAHQGPSQPANIRDGFEISTDGPPLPPGARSTRRLSSSMSFLESSAEPVLIASNSFTPNPLMDLTLSQKTFRNTLAIPGQSTSYMDAGSSLPRATEDGEQAQMDLTVKEESFHVPAAVGPNSNTSRPAGKLYGKSLIDDLESRKAQMRSKQRVFTGDQRPSMMARESSRRISTLIDPATLLTRPTNQRGSSYGSLGPEQGLARHPSITMKPLISFESEDKGLGTPPMAGRLPSNRSVFGVDTLWQREMEKLKEIQAVEEKENEERRIREEAEERRKRVKKDKRRKKGKNKTDEAVQLAPPPIDYEDLASPRVSAEPPMLPNIQRASRRAPPIPSDSGMSSESDEDQFPVVANDVAWHSSDDEEAGPRRTTGVGLRYRQPPARNAPSPISNGDSEEDLPLAATIQKARQRTNTRQYLQPDSEDEDKPLSRIIMESKSSKALSSTSRNHGDEDDDQPLGLRALRIPFKPVNGDDEDDMPLAFHPEHQRRTQYQMMAQQQQQAQQQHMMMQAQLQSNMMMNASMMGPGYYNPTMMNPMAMMRMQAPMPMPSPPPIHDEAKLVRVDRWRRDVVVEGENI